MTGEVDAKPDMGETYACLLRWAANNYSAWQPEFIEHMRIRYGQRLSGDWPRLAYVSQLTNHMRAMDTVVNDRQHIQTKRWFSVAPMTIQPSRKRRDKRPTLSRTEKFFSFQAWDTILMRKCPMS